MARISIFSLGLCTLAFSQSAYASIPQLDPTWYASQIFWLTICFGLLIVLVKVNIAPTIGNVLEARKRAIDSAIAEAETMRNKAADANATMTSGMSSAKANASALLLKAQREQAERLARANAELEADLKAKTDTADRSIDAAKNAALQEISSGAAEVAQAMVKQLLGQSVSAEASKAAVSAASKAA